MKIGELHSSHVKCCGMLHLRSLSRKAVWKPVLCSKVVAMVDTYSQMLELSCCTADMCTKSSCLHTALFVMLGKETHSLAKFAQMLSRASVVRAA